MMMLSLIANILSVVPESNETSETDKKIKRASAFNLEEPKISPKTKRL